VMHVESGANQRAQSQRTPWADADLDRMRARYGLGAIPTTPATTFWLVATSATLRSLRRARVPRRLQCRTWTLERHLGTGRPLPDETQAYVATLTPIINHARTNVQLGAVTRSLPGLALRCCGAQLASHRMVVLGLTCVRSAMRAHGTVDLSGLVPHSRNLLVHLIGEMRSR
jgi:hypothetical protein